MKVSKNSTNANALQMIRRWLSPGPGRAFHYPKEAQAAGLQRARGQVRPLI